MSSSMAVAAENYHLKWDSHSSHMNLSLANLFKNEKFADVILLTSNSLDNGPGILAHKIILTLCSSYFASIFDNINSAISGTTRSSVTTNNGITCIVLPPELSRRSIKCLIQYMYSGEATVSNDILNEVLRGGELLKIRGLCRNNGNTNNSSNNNTRNEDTRKNNIDIETNSSVITILPKESPVIVKPPKHCSSSLIIDKSTSSLPSPTTARRISIRKDIAIDPDECNSSSSKYHRNESPQQRQLSQNEIFSDTPNRRTSVIESSPLHNEEIRSNGREGILETENLQYSKDNETTSSLNFYNRPVSSPNNSRILIKRTSDVSQNEKCSDNIETELPSIKKEPNEWLMEQRNNNNNNSNRNGNSNNSPIITQTINEIKVESDHNSEDTQSTIDKENDEDNLSFPPFKCELCSGSFTAPEDWVRHIEEHSMDSSNSSNTLPPTKKRKLAQSEFELIATLKCDLCTTYYDTPAEWVRHMQNFHTETELAISNVQHGGKTSTKTEKDAEKQQKMQTATSSSNTRRKKGDRVSDYETY